MSEGGGSLSGGERSRIAFVRAFLKDAPIILPDEAMAALDRVNERALHLALSRLVAGHSVIVVTHRRATIESADQILVPEKGRIVEQGCHAGLLAAGGRRQLCRPLVPSRKSCRLADRRSSLRLAP